MADLTELQSAGTTKIVGSDSTGAETNAVNATPNGDLNVNDGLSVGGVTGNLNLVTSGTTYEAKVGGSRLTNRKSLIINAFDSDMFWGYANSVTTSTGFPIFKGQTITFSIDANSSTFQVWLVCANNNKNVRIVETP
jgi:hypothetical protein